MTLGDFASWYVTNRVKPTTVGTFRFAEPITIRKDETITLTPAIHFPAGNISYARVIGCGWKITKDGEEQAN